MEAKSDGAEFDEMRAAMPSDARVQAIRDRIAGELRPVKPLPQDWVLVTALTAAFICLGVACAIPVGLKGFHAMTAGQRLLDYAVILFCAMGLARALVSEIIPGARRRVSPGLVLAAAFAATAAVTVLLFPDYSTMQFVQSGIRCLAIGSVCAVPAAALVWRVMRLGFLTDRLSAILTAAMLCGMAGVFTLALHCPILTAAHILTWHLGFGVLCLAVGVLVARRIERWPLR